MLQPAEPIDHPFIEIARFACGIHGAELNETDDQALERFARPFAEMFLVSPIAMRIRLEKPRAAAPHSAASAAFVRSFMSLF
ncbi:hypothetical protein ABIB75_007669 [Bradyrhizobium sp. GM2.2]|uniref:hypothetical protein n=1 Tax=Bradyrhizobium sp. GM2.2 TaxID=3156358 RepID=UPI00339721DF